MPQSSYVSFFFEMLTPRESPPVCWHLGNLWCYKKYIFGLCPFGSWHRASEALGMSWVIGVSFVIWCKEPFHHTCVYANEMTQGGPSDSHCETFNSTPNLRRKRLEIWVQLTIARDLINYANAVKPGYNSLNKEIHSTSCPVKHDMTGGCSLLTPWGQKLLC